MVCPTQFKTQKFCGMLREICPEIDTAVSGMFTSSRYTENIYKSNINQKDDFMFIAYNISIILWALLEIKVYLLLMHITAKHTLRI